MSESQRRPAPLEFKQDLEEAAKRWDAFYAGEIIDRPIVCVTAPREGFKRPPGSNYHERVHGDMDDIIERAITSAAATSTIWICSNGFRRAARQCRSVVVQSRSSLCTGN